MAHERSNCLNSENSIAMNAPIVQSTDGVTLVGGGPLEAAVAAGLGGTPTAAAAYTLAREMGGDAQLVAAIITATTLLSFLTLPLVIGLTLP